MHCLVKPLQRALFAQILCALTDAAIMHSTCIKVHTCGGTWLSLAELSLHVHDMCCACLCQQCIKLVECLQAVACFMGVHQYLESGLHDK